MTEFLDFNITEYKRWQIVSPLNYKLGKWISYNCFYYDKTIWKNFLASMSVIILFIPEEEFDKFITLRLLIFDWGRYINSNLDKIVYSFL